MKKIIVVFTIIILIAASASAQSFFGFGWEVNFPANDAYIKKTSFAGGKLEYRYLFNKKFSAGVAFNWASYEEYFPRQTIQKPDGNGAVTSDFVAQVYQVPITATAHYYFKQTKLLKPYAGIAIGGQYLEQSIYYNVYVSEDNNWGFVVRPEVGVVISPSSFDHWGILFAAGYSYSTNKTEVIDRNNFKNIGLTLGIALALD